MPMASNNHDALKENGAKRVPNNGGTQLSTSCNGSAEPTRKVDRGGPETAKFVTSNVGGEKPSKPSKGVKVKGKSRRGGSGKNSVGTLDQAIHKRNIFTAVAKMPAEIQTTLVENGWIGKITVNDDCFRRSGATVEVISLHNNIERVKVVVKRYESGLVWTDAHSGGVNWMTLKPNVVVNRFPRDANAALKLCGHALAGKSKFDGHYPRAYPARTEGIHADSFVADYSLTACVSLLRAFVDGGHHTMCAKTGQVPLSALNFATKKCHQYLTDGKSLRTASFPGKGAVWETFFEHYYKIVHDRRKFTVPVAADDEEVTLRYLTASSGQLVDQLTAARPQTAMDGYQNMWIVKSTAAVQCGRPLMLNKIGDLLDQCARVQGGAADHIVQKYIETPLLRDNVKSDVHTWIVLSTLDGRLTVWLHRTCAVQPYPHGFSLHQDASKAGHFDRLKSGALHGMLRPSALTCGLKQLVESMRNGKKMSKQKRRYRHQKRVDNDDGEDDDDDGGVYSAVRRSVVSAMAAVATGGSLDLRPNCLELFRGTFVLGDDARPWLIDIVSDDPCLDADCSREGDRVAPSAVMARSVARGVAKMLVDSGRGRATRIGMFDMVHECSMPVGAMSYAPRPFVESAPTSAAYRLLATRTDQPHSLHMSTARSPRKKARHHNNWWDDNSISTYVQTISADDVQDQPQAESLPTTGLKVTVSAVEAELSSANDVELSSVDDADSSSNVVLGSSKNRDLCGSRETRRCLKMLKNCKTKIASVQKICKSIIHGGHNNSRNP